MSDTRVLIVNVKGGAEFTSITEAIKAAVDGDTIQVHMGQYDEVVLLDRAVHVVAEPGSERGDIVVGGGAVLTANGSLAGLTFHQMVDVRKGSVSIKQCDVSLGSDGIRVCSDAEAVIDGCTIRQAQSGGDGVYVQEHGKATVVGCTIEDNRVNAIHANGGEVNVSGCTIRRSPFGVYFRRKGVGLVDGNTFEDLGYFGVYITDGSDPTISKNSIIKPDELSGAAMMISNGGLGTIKDNTVHGSVRILRGCAPTLGVNTINGRLDNENVIPPPMAPAGASIIVSSPDARKASVRA